MALWIHREHADPLLVVIVVCIQSGDCVTVTIACLLSEHYISDDSGGHQENQIM
jgi:hypothetical protein